MQDFLDEEFLENAINEFIKVEHSIQYNKVVQEINDITYEIYTYEDGMVESIMNDVLCSYKPIESQQQSYTEFYKLDTSLPYNKAFEDNFDFDVYNDNTTSFSLFPGINEKRIMEFRKNRPMYGSTNRIYWNNEKRYEHLL